MKRHAALIPLAREHHAALVFCRWAVGQGGDESAPLDASQWQKLSEFQVFFLAHADVEERELFDWAQCAGATIAWDDLLDQHRAIRRQFCDTKTTADLNRLGALLEAHTRWEDRELFCLLERHASSPSATTEDQKQLEDHADHSIAA